NGERPCRKIERMSAVFHSNEKRSVAAGASPLAVGVPGRTIAFDARGPVTLARFMAEVHGVAAALPAAAYVPNLCEDRYRFLVAFCAAATRGQVTLLPASRADATVAQLRSHYPDSYCIVDADCSGASLAGSHVLDERLPQADGPIPDIAADALVAIGFTSGSTGQPSATPKRWQAFHSGTGQNLAALAGLLTD